MSYGAPWERGAGTADMMPLRDMEVPGLDPDAEGVELNTKEARRHRYQRGRRQRRQEEKSSQKARSKEDEDRCLGVLAAAVEANRRELSVVSRGLDLCESTICNDIASVRAWVMGALIPLKMHAGGLVIVYDVQDGHDRDEHRGVGAHNGSRGRLSRRSAPSLAGMTCS